MPAEGYHFQGRSLIRPLNQPYPFQGCRPIPQWMIVPWWVVVVKDRLYILQCRLLDPDCNKTPRQGKHGPPSAGPNYISQDEDEEYSHGYNTRSWTTSIMQEAMLACINITKQNFEISAAKMASQKLPMTWFCEMAN